VSSECLLTIADLMLKKQQHAQDNQSLTII
jgi:hypothetical protein